MNTTQAPAVSPVGDAVAVPQETLDRLRAGCHKAHQYALAVASHVVRNQWREAREKAHVVAETVRIMGVALDQAGANRPDGMPPAPRPLPAAWRDTPATRRYLAALREAHAAALDMDEERDEDDGAESQMVELLVRDAEKGLAEKQTATQHGG